MSDNDSATAEPAGVKYLFVTTCPRRLEVEIEGRHPYRTNMPETITLVQGIEAVHRWFTREETSDLQAFAKRIQVLRFNPEARYIKVRIGE